MRRLASPKVTIQTRVMLAILLVSCVALANSGVLIWILGIRGVERGVDDQLRAERSQLRVLAEDGLHPATGEPLTTPAMVVETYLGRTVLQPSESALGFLDGKATWTVPSQVQLRPEDDTELLTAIAPLASGSESVIETVRTSRSTYRVLVVPVIEEGQPVASLVHVVDMEAAAADLRRMMLLYTAAALISVALVAGLAWFAVDRLVRPIEELRRAAESIDERDLTSRVPVRGRDDLSALAETVNRMLDRVQRAIEGQRELLDDVGHELRTPITIIRGHLELIDPTDVTDVRQTQELALDELDRMGVLVNDLLLLAKSTQAGFVSPTPTDVAALTDQVLDKAQALGERRWSLDARAEVLVMLDAARTTQAWLQLAANAVKYSAPDSPVSLGSRIEEGDLLMWVADRGIGIAPDDLETVRQRFGRSRIASQHAAGSGLGLSIVQNIVSAHGGALDIDSVLGEGSCFTLRIPLGLDQTPDPHPEEQTRP
ncbi:MAG: HAMP domain-containing sensor histidine kinase [Actinomyces sp.]|uniref:sensor histidine kinase n=1 Tax=Actinomyces sp. TaxID=29317 RepID=UPI0026DD9DEF|nr:HAMP domain-containing sensor histidine kinase [Actinomyces sp.]MDO4242642.1 HAMP domain-containing sensor histidine kinase [Actinomyces sp.]